METHDPNVYPTILGAVLRGFWSPFLKRFFLGHPSPHLIFKFVSQQSVTIQFQNFSVSKLFKFYMVSDSVSKKIRFGINEVLVSEKVSDSVSFRFWVSSHALSQFGLLTIQNSVFRVNWVAEKYNFVRITNILS